MFKNKTVFVLGAGASKPFEYPTGQELRSFLCEEVYDGKLSQLLLEAGNDQATLQLFAMAFERSSLDSIDRFLALRPGAAAVGKMAIAAAILFHQYEPNLYRASDRRGTGDWYQFVWNRMAPPGIAKPEDALENKVSFITFNYDVSLERLFFNSFMHSFGLGEPQALDLVRQLSIHHVYGSVAQNRNAAFTSHEGWPESAPPAKLKSLSEGIKVMPSDRPERDEHCFRELSDASMIIGLGFGFDEMNCARLGLREALDPGDKLIATTFGLTDSERAVIRNRLGASRAGLVDMTCLQLLRAHAERLG